MFRKLISLFVSKPYRFVGTLLSQDYFLNPIKVASEMGFDSLTFTPYKTGIFAGYAKGVKKDGGIIFLHGLNRKMLFVLIFFSLFRFKKWKTVWFTHMSFGQGYPFAMPFDILRYLKLVILRLDLVACISLYEYEFLKKRGFRNAAFVPLPLDFKYFNSIKRHPQASGILFMGGDRKVKNLETVLKAFKIVRQKKPGATLLVLGKVKKKRKLAGVKYLGVLKAESSEFRDVFARSGVFVSASFYEGQSMGILEAAAAGMSLCLSDIPSVRRLFGRSALFNDPFDFVTLAKNMTMRRSHKDNIKIAKGYDISVFRKKLREVLCQI